MRDPTTPAVTRLMRRQHGLISREQARRSGLDDGAVKYLLASGRWERVAPSVYGVPAHRLSWNRNLWAAHLHAGEDSVVSHESAARVRGFDQVRAGMVDLIVPAGKRHPPPGVRWHRRSDLRPEDVSKVDGLPVTTAVRTVIDVGEVIHVARLRLLVEQGIVENRFTIEALGAAIERVRRSGKRGVRVVGEVLDDLGPGEGLPHSELEKLLDGAIDLAGLPRPEHEHPLPGTGAVVGFVDRCWPEVRLIVEADGRKWHTRRQQQARDNQRSLESQAVGYETSRFMWEHLRHDPHGSARTLRAIYEQRERLLRHDA